MADDQHGIEADFEPEEEFGGIPAAQAKLKKLREELKEAQKKRDEYLDGWQRCKADSVNARRELLAQAERASARGREALVEDIIPVLDSFDMAATHESWEAVDESWRSGIDQIRSQLIDVLARHGVERFGKVGDPFDHALHEAVEESDDVAGEPHTIARILRFGYKMGDRVIRPVQAVVKK